MNKKYEPKSLTKYKLSEILAKESLFTTEKDALAIINRIFGEISSVLNSGLKKVVIKDFGSFESYDTKVKRGRNPKTGEKMLIPPMRKIRFKQSKNALE
jgi:nucleoid DNA-binding protein